MGLLTLVVMYVLVQLILCCSQLVCKRIEQGITQAEARIIMLNMLEDKEEEKDEVLGLMTINDYKS